MTVPAFYRGGLSADNDRKPPDGKAPGCEDEMPGFDRRMTREEINSLPLMRLPSEVRVVSNGKDLSAAVRRLSRERVLGFDTETRPSFKRGEIHPPALLQLAGRERVYLFRLRDLKFPRVLRQVLSCPHIIKAGVAPDFDLEKLKELGPFREAGFVDLVRASRSAGIKNHGLRGLAAVLLGYRISKGAQRSNWARTVLTQAQITYAATDAWVSRELYLHLEGQGYGAPISKAVIHDKS